MNREYIEDKAAARIELENEAIQEAFDAKVNNLRQDHNFFAQFIKDSSGEEYINLLIKFAITFPDICYSYKEYTEQWIKEGE